MACVYVKLNAYSSLQLVSMVREFTCHMGSPGRGDIPAFSQTIKTGTQFSDLGEMQGWVDPAGMVTYWGGILAGRSLSVLTGLNVK